MAATEEPGLRPMHRKKLTRLWPLVDLVQGLHLQSLVLDIGFGPGQTPCSVGFRGQ